MCIRDSQRTLLRPGDTHGIRGITEGELNGQLYVYGWGENGPRRLGDERFFDTPGFVSEGDVEFQYNDFQDPHSSKSIKEVYPACSVPLNVQITMTNNIRGDITYPTARMFDPSDEYKMDYRLHGRYYSMRLSADGATNPEITSVGLEVRKGGER